MGHAAATEDTPIYHEVLRDLGIDDFSLDEELADAVTANAVLSAEPEQSVAGYRVERATDR